MTDIEDVLDARGGDLDHLDDTVMGEVVGIAHAAGDLRKALDVLDRVLDERRFEAAAALGYADIASAFIFLQRTLGGLQVAEYRKHALISEVAQEMRLAYEEVEPHVTARLKSSQPKAT